MSFGFDDQMHALRRVEAQFRKGVATEDVQDLTDRDASGARRGSGDNLVAAVFAADGMAESDRILREIAHREKPAIGLACRHKRARDRASVKGAGSAAF